MNQRLVNGIKTTIFMAVLSVILIMGVAYLHQATEPRVKLNEKFFLQQAIMKVSGTPLPDDANEVVSWFEQNAKQIDTNQVWSVKKDDFAEPIVVYFVQGRGLWGKIKAVAGVNPNDKSFTGVHFLEQNETPGLGARITEDWFCNQLIGKRSPLKLQPEGTRSVAIDEIDGVTGATITSQAVRDMLNSISALKGEAQGE